MLMARGVSLTHTCKAATPALAMLEGRATVLLVIFSLSVGGEAVSNGEIAGASERASETVSGGGGGRWK